MLRRDFLSTLSAALVSYKFAWAGTPEPVAIDDRRELIRLVCSLRERIRDTVMRMMLDVCFRGSAFGPDSLSKALDVVAQNCLKGQTCLKSIYLHGVDTSYDIEYCSTLVKFSFEGELTRPQYMPLNSNGLRDPGDVNVYLLSDLNNRVRIDITFEFKA